MHNPRNSNTIDPVYIPRTPDAFPFWFVHHSLDGLIARLDQDLIHCNVLGLFERIDD